MYFRGVKGKGRAAKGGESVNRNIVVQEDVTVQEPESRGEKEIK